MDSSLDWAGLLAQFDIRVTQLPAVGDCPQCGEPQLYIYPDKAVGGPWTVCEGCRWHGDIIEFAAAGWKLDQAATVAKMRTLGIHPGPVLGTSAGLSNAQHQWQQRQYLREWLEKFAENFVDGSAEQSQIIQMLTGMPGTDRSTRIRCRHIFGSASWHELASMGKQLRLRTTFKRLVPGMPPWLLVLAFCDLPGRVIGLRLIWRDGGQIQRVDWVMHNYTDTGVVNLHARHSAPDPVLGQNLSLLRDDVLFTRLLLQHHSQHKSKLPIMLAHPDVDRIRSFAGNLWQRPVTVIGDERNTPALLRLAHRVDGNVSQHRQLQENTGSDPRAFLRHMLRHACPWDVRFRTLLQDADAITATSLFDQVGLTLDARMKFLQNSPPKLQERLTKLGVLERLYDVVEVEGRHIRCGPDGWYYGKQQICNVDIQLDRRLHRRDGRVYYAGCAVRGQDIWPIRLTAPSRHNSIFVQLEKQLSRRGVTLTYVPSWWSLGFRIAMLRHAIVDHYNRDCVGWDDRGGVFRFPQFTLDLEGRADIADFTDYRARIVPPASQLMPPDIVGERDFDLVRAQSGNRLFWAIAAAVLQNGLAPAFNLQARNIALVNTGRLSLGKQIAEALTTPLVTGIAAIHTPRLLDTHAWPTFATMSTRQAYTDDIVINGSAQIITTTTRITARSLATYGWTVIDCPPGLTMSRDALAAGLRLVSNYLQDICRRRGQFHIPATNSRERVLLDLAEWYRRHAGQPIRLEHIRRQADYGEHMPRWCGLIDILAEHTVKHRPRIVFVESAHAVGIDLQALHAVLTRHRAGMIDVTSVAEELTQLGALLSNVLPDGTYGWLIDRTWWQKHATRHRNTRQMPYSLPAQ